MNNEIRFLNVLFRHLDSSRQLLYIEPLNGNGYLFFSQVYSCGCIIIIIKRVLGFLCLICS